VIHTWQYAYLFLELDSLLKENLHQEQNPDDQLPGLSRFLLILEHLSSLKSRSRYTAEIEIVKTAK
jgi:hypothetical protein